MRHFMIILSIGFLFVFANCGSDDSNFGVPNIQINIPAAFKPSARNAFHTFTLPTGSVYNEIKNNGIEERGKEFGRGILMPQLVFCVAKHIWGLTDENFNDVTAFNFDLSDIDTNPSNVCYAYRQGTPGAVTALALRGRCWDLGTDHSSGYRYLCKAIVTADNASWHKTAGEVAFEIAYTVTSASADENYSGRGYAYTPWTSWFEWDINNGVSARVWGIKSESAASGSLLYWTNYFQATDDYVTQLFSWQSMGGGDPEGTTGGRAYTPQSLYFYDGVYNYSTNYGKLRYNQYAYVPARSWNYNQIGAAEGSTYSCFEGSTTANSVVGACDLDDGQADSCGSSYSGCNAVATSSIPTPLGTAAAIHNDYLRKYANVDLGDGVNVGIRFQEKFGSYTVE